MHAAVHDQHAVAALAHHAQVVGDHDGAHPELARQPGQQLQDLGLDHHVQGGGRLVGHDHVRLAGQGQRDHGPLAHAAREGVRVLVRSVAGRCPTRSSSSSARCVAPRPSDGRLVDPDRLGHLVAHPAHRVERVHGALEDDRQPRPAERRASRARRATAGPRRRTGPARPPRGRRAAAGAAWPAWSSSCPARLPDQADRLAPAQVEARRRSPRAAVRSANRTRRSGRGR